MTNTHAMQILLHQQSSQDGIEKHQFDEFLNDVRILAKKHDIEFAQYESFTLNGSDYHIAPCDRCKDLTIEKNDLDDEVKEMVSFFWEYIREGEVNDNTSLCQACKIATS